MTKMPVLKIVLGLCVIVSSISLLYINYSETRFNNTFSIRPDIYFKKGISKWNTHHFNIHFVGFYTEGPPHDNSLNLSSVIEPIINHLPIGTTYKLYSPRIILSELPDYSWSIKSRPPGVVSGNPGMSYTGNAAWKAVIIYKELEKLKYGDILIYRDGNVIKNKLLMDWDTVMTQEKILNVLSDFDFFIAQDKGNKHPLKYFTKNNIVNELGCDDKKFVSNFPLLVANQIAIRKSNVSMELLQEWISACKTERYIDGIDYSPSNEFKWSTPEQAILSVIIANWIKTRKNNIPKNYPSHYGGRWWSDPITSTDGKWIQPHKPPHKMLKVIAWLIILLSLFKFIFF